MKRGLVVLSVVGLMCAGVATAAVQQGDTEVEALGGFLTENAAGGGGDVSVWFLSGAVGYFLTDNIQVQGAAAWASLDNTTNVDVWALGARAKYHFMPTNQWVPYVGGQVLWANADAGNDFDGDGILWGPVAGLRYELNANNDFFAEYQYHLWSGDVGDLIDDGHAIFVGIVHQFK